LKPIYLLLLLATLLPLHAQTGEKLVTSARKQVGVTVSYDPAYTTSASYIT